MRCEIDIESLKWIMFMDKSEYYLYIVTTSSASYILLLSVSVYSTFHSRMLAVETQSRLYSILSLLLCVPSLFFSTPAYWKGERVLGKLLEGGKRSNFERKLLFLFEIMPCAIDLIYTCMSVDFMCWSTALDVHATREELQVYVQNYKCFMSMVLHAKSSKKQ